jgi:hypothetical protein
MATRLFGRAVAVLSVLAAACSPGCGRIRSAPTATVPAAEAGQRLAELWIPRDAAGLDLYYGAGNASEMPARGATFQFVQKDTKGFSPGWDVKDAQGREWSVKLGPEAHSEVVASRILWALGYRQPPMYHVEAWTLEGGPEPGPQPAGRFRPDVPGAKRSTWSWEKNPFADTRELRGLLVLMRIINNWDLLDRNNALYEFSSPQEGPRRWYVVVDLGAAFGKSLGHTKLDSGTRSDVDDFEAQGFVEGVSADGTVDFDDVGKWHRGLFSRLTADDVRWTCERLAALSDSQWHDAFRAGGYDEATRTRFVAAMRARIKAGLALANTPKGER